MLQTLLITLKLHFRQKIQLFWLFAFPIILATMFNGMFGNISENYALHTFDMAVVEDAAWKANPGLQTLIAGISTDRGSSDSDTTGKVVDDDGDMPKLINAIPTTSRASADRLLADGKAQGYLYADSSGRLHMAVSESTQGSVTDVMANSSGLGISLTMLNNIVNLYNRTGMVITDILATNPTAMMDGRLTDLKHRRDIRIHEGSEAHELQTGRNRPLLLRIAGHDRTDGDDLRREHGDDGAGESVDAGRPPFRGTIGQMETARSRIPGQLVLLVPKPDGRDAVHPLRMRHIARRARMGRDRLLRGGILLRERIRHVYRSPAEDADRRQTWIVHGNLVHTVALFRTVRFVRHGPERYDRPACAIAQSHKPGPADHEPVL